MKYVPILEEERFQSMVAVPILSRAGETIGVIVLHTRGAARVQRGHAQAARPHRLAGVGRDRERTALRPRAPPGRRAHRAVRARPGSRRRRRRPASSGRRRARARARCSAPRSASCTASTATAPAGAARLEPGRDAAEPGRCRRPDLLLAALDGRGSRPARADAVAGARASAALLVTPLTAGGERVGLLCAGSPPGSRSPARTPRSRARSRTWPRSRSSAPS